MADDSVISVQIEGKPPATLPFHLRLGTLRSSRQSFARLLREYSKGRVEDRLYKNLCWGMSMYLGYLRTEKELDIEKRLEQIEAALKEGRT